MEPDTSSSRTGLAGEIAQHLDPSFLLLPPTVRFPHPVVAHGDLGLAAIVVYSGVALLDERTGKWFGPSDSIDPLAVAAETALDLAASARAPADRVTALVWMPSGLSGGSETPVDQVVASPSPELAANAVQDLMTRRLTGSTEPTTPWLGSYVAGAMGPKDRLSTPLRRLIAATEFSLSQMIGDEVITSYGHELTVADLVDPQFLFPALVIAASEDWRLATRKKSNGTGFSVDLAPDPSSLLGYRLTNILPAVPFTALAPIISTVRRCKDGPEYNIEDLIRQFMRWLKKNNMDATVLDDVGHRLATSL